MFDSANDPRRSGDIQGPEIGDIDSLEVHSDDSFFDFEKLNQAECQQEMIGNIAPCASDIDSDGDIMPEFAFSSTDDKTSTNTRIRRNREKRQDMSASQSSTSH